MIRTARRRRYDLVVLSDHGSTPSRSYRVRFGEPLGATVQRLVDEATEAARRRTPLYTLTSYAEDSEFADVGPHVVQTVAAAAHPAHRRTRWLMRRIARWLRSRYGLRELLFPEKYRVDERNDIVVTYSSCLAHLYFADTTEQLERQDLARDRRRAALYAGLLEHPGVGLLLTRAGRAVYVQSRAGRALLVDAQLEVLAGTNPLEPYGVEPWVLRAVERLVRQPNSGDIVIFGAYDGYDIISFDDQVGAHGSAGGDQVYPFLITPPSLDLSGETIEDARDIHRLILARYAVTQPVSEGER